MVCDVSKRCGERKEGNCLEQSLGFTHGRLDVERPDVLPLDDCQLKVLDRCMGDEAYLLLEKRDQEVDGQHGVLHDVVFGHVNVTDGDTETEDLLQLELDGRLDFGDLSGEVLGVGNGGGELSSLGKTGTQETGDLLDQGLGSEESVVLLCELLDELLVLALSARYISSERRKNIPC
jgi:hypothetical protein